MKMVWLTWLLLLPCGLAYKEYSTSRSTPWELNAQASAPVSKTLSSLGVATPYVDWSISSWINLSGGSVANLLTTSPAYKAEVTGGNLVLSGDSITTQTKAVTFVQNQWFMLILGSNAAESYAVFATRTGSTVTATAGGAVVLTGATTFRLMSFVSGTFLARVM